jgi:hypothetical protein
MVEGVTYDDCALHRSDTLCVNGVSAYFTSRAKESARGEEFGSLAFQIKGTLKGLTVFPRIVAIEKDKSHRRKLSKHFAAYRTVGKVSLTLKNVKLRLADSNVSL